MMPKGKRPRGLCASCGRDVPIKADGTPRVHRAPNALMCDGRGLAWKPRAARGALEAPSSKTDNDPARPR